MIKRWAHLHKNLEYSQRLNPARRHLSQPPDDNILWDATEAYHESEHFGSNVPSSFTALQTPMH